MSEPKCARDVYEANVAKRKSAGFELLKADDPLPEYAYSDHELHPWEVEVFGIDPMLQHNLSEAWCWYSGAIAVMDHNDYWAFRREERKRFPHMIKVPEDAKAIIFDRVDCAVFMHEAAGLPLRQCQAWVSKMEAVELRDHVHNKFRDGS